MKKIVDLKKKAAGFSQRGSQMLKFIAFNYALMLNGYGQWLNIRKKRTSVV